MKLAVMYRTIIYANLKSPFSVDDCNFVNDQLYATFKDKEDAIWLIDAMSRHQHYNDAAMRFQHGNRSTIAPASSTKFVFSKLGTPQAHFDATIGGGQTPLGHTVH